MPGLQHESLQEQRVVAEGGSRFAVTSVPAQAMLGRMRRGDTDEAASEPSEEVVLLTQIRDLLSNRAA